MYLLKISGLVSRHLQSCQKMDTLASLRKRALGPDTYFWALFIELTGAILPERTVTQAPHFSVQVSLQCPGPAPYSNRLGRGNTRGAPGLSKY